MLPSTSAFKFNLRRYRKRAREQAEQRALVAGIRRGGLGGAAAGGGGRA